MQHHMLMILAAQEDGAPYFGCSKRQMMILLLVDYVDVWMRCRVTYDDTTQSPSLGILYDLQNTYSALIHTNTTCALADVLSNEHDSVTNCEIDGLAVVLLDVGKCVAETYLGFNPELSIESTM